MTTKLTTLVVLLLVATVLMAQAPGGQSGPAKQVCQLVSANPPDFNPFQFVPKVADFTKLNCRRVGQRLHVEMVLGGWGRVEHRFSAEHGDELGCRIPAGFRVRVLIFL